ncbi:hypothetical protein RRG08_062825 [Elysia crispata]|uniref:Uncharacterized protein n=1 Tax=Elysia crispata TaxID=231223 RepID=A0AAE1DPR5_9GAST|nr:hypothetical protein RRG08_062825 [Elysia crispata]
MGFNVPRLELATIPNNKTSENEVPMPTPMHAEMWTFVDSNGDYGVPVRDENGGAPHIKRELSITSPYDIYDLKLHPGYKSVPATDATAFAMEFSPAEQKWSFFPHVQVGSLDGSHPPQGVLSDNDVIGYSLDDDNNGNVAQWPVNYVATPLSIHKGMDQRAATTDE